MRSAGRMPRRACPPEVQQGQRPRGDRCLRPQAVPDRAWQGGCGAPVAVLFSTLHCRDPGQDAAVVGGGVLLAGIERKSQSLGCVGCRGAVPSGPRLQRGQWPQQRRQRSTAPSDLAQPTARSNSSTARRASSPRNSAALADWPSESVHRPFRRTRGAQQCGGGRLGVAARSRSRPTNQCGGDGRMRPSAPAAPASRRAASLRRGNRRLTQAIWPASARIAAAASVPTRPSVRPRRAGSRMPRSARRTRIRWTRAAGRSLPATPCRTPGAQRCRAARARSGLPACQARRELLPTGVAACGSGVGGQSAATLESGGRGGVPAAGRCPPADGLAARRAIHRGRPPQRLTATPAGRRPRRRRAPRRAPDWPRAAPETSHPVDGGADQRVAEQHPVVDDRTMPARSASSSAPAGPEQLRCRQHAPASRRSARRRPAAAGSGWLGPGGGPGRGNLLQAVADRHRAGQRCTAGELVGGQRPGQFPQASGFPAVVDSRSRTWGTITGPSVEQRARRTGIEAGQTQLRQAGGGQAPSRGRGPRTTAGRPSASNRRATKVRASADGPSSHCASSIRHSTGCCSAASESMLRMPSDTRKRSWPAAGPMPNALRGRCQSLGNTVEGRGPAGSAGAPPRRGTPTRIRCPCPAEPNPVAFSARNPEARICRYPPRRGGPANRSAAPNLRQHPSMPRIPVAARAPACRRRRYDR